MTKLVLVRQLWIILLAVFLAGCGETSDVNDKKNNDQISKTDSEGNNEEVNGTLSETSKSFVRVDTGRLQVSTFLVLDEDQPSALARFAEIAENEKVLKIRSRVFIDKYVISGANVRVGMELAFQASRNQGKKTDLTLVRNQFTYKDEGFRLSGKAIGCKNEDCSQFFESSAIENGNYPLNSLIDLDDAHTLSLEWDKSNFRFMYTFDKASGYLDMDEFIKESGFNPRNFLSARLFVAAKKTGSTKEGSRIVARFGDVFINDELYDDFSGDELNLEKWRIAEIYH